MHAYPGDDLMMAHTEIERGAPFCENPTCALHVRARDAQVEGGGNWLTLPDGRIFGRRRAGERLLCDACASHRGPVQLEGNTSQEAKRCRARQ